MEVNNTSIPARILVYSVFAIILSIGMKEMASIFTAVFFSIFVALIFAPLVRWFMRKGIPGLLSVILVISLFILIALVFGVIAVKAAIQFGSQIAIYQVQLAAFFNDLAKNIPSYEGFSAESIIRGMVSITVTLMVSIVSGIVNAGTTFGVIIVTTTFLLIDTVNTPEKTNKKIGKQPELQLKFDVFSRKLTKFITRRTELNIITAILLSFLLFVIGIDYVILWGVLIFLLSYIPYIGLVIASIPVIMLTLFKYGPSAALVFIVIIFAADVLVEKVVFPSLTGKGMQLSPAFLFIAFICMNFIFGFKGLLLSLPLIIILKILFESFEETKWIARLMGPVNNIDDN